MARTFKTKPCPVESKIEKSPFPADAGLTKDPGYADRDELSVTFQGQKTMTECLLRGGK